MLRDFSIASDRKTLKHAIELDLYYSCSCVENKVRTKIVYIDINSDAWHFD